MWVFLLSLVLLCRVWRAWCVLALLLEGEPLLCLGETRWVWSECVVCSRGVCEQGRRGDRSRLCGTACGTFGAESGERRDGRARTRVCWDARAHCKLLCAEEVRVVLCVAGSIRFVQSYVLALHKNDPCTL